MKIGDSDAPQRGLDRIRDTDQANQEGAVELRNRLRNFVTWGKDNGGDKQAHNFEDVSSSIAELVEGTCLDHPGGEQFPWVSIVVQPRIDFNQTNWGFSLNDTVYRFRVLIEPSVMTWATAEALMEAQYPDLCPDVSYNAVLLESTTTVDERKQAAVNAIDNILHEFGSNDSDPGHKLFNTGWFSIQIPRDREDRLRDLASYIQGFHTLKLLPNKQAAEQFIPAVEVIVLGSLEDEPDHAPPPKV
ncbi:hypothetical protein FRC09_020672 [Ceratobasidium sp. 395]|nr:hypothetical protein FRC09_020672 [Ceratobasidium sp. 395]